jgi:uncharacterized membrane protein YcfT
MTVAAHTRSHPLSQNCSWRADSRDDAARVAWIDVAKGACIILVVMMHSTLGLGEAVGRTGWLHAAVEFARPFRIPAFFLIAGLFLSRSIHEPLRRFLDRKVLHFVYFYLLWTLIQCAFKAPLAGGGFAAQFATALIEPFGTLWFIYLLPIFFVTTRLVRRAPVWLVLVEAAALHVWPHATGVTVIDEFMGRYVFFFAGYAFAPIFFRIAELARDNRDAAIAATAAVFALIAAATFGANPFTGAAPFIQTPGVSLALGLAGAAALIAAASLLGATPFGAVLKYCGERSLAIYLFFFLPMAMTRMTLVKTGLAGGALDVGTASLVITFVAVSAALVFERVAAGGPFGWLLARPTWARMPEAAADARQPAE